jgi:hypothetical protein
MAIPGQGRIERRLPPILAADLAGYSRLMSIGEAGTTRGVPRGSGVWGIRWQ